MQKNLKNNSLTTHVHRTLDLPDLGELESLERSKKLCNMREFFDLYQKYLADCELDYNHGGFEKTAVLLTTAAHDAISFFNWLPKTD